LKIKYVFELIVVFRRSRSQEEAL